MRFDFRHLLSLGVDDAGILYTFGEAIGHVQTLASTPGTHTHASVEEWEWPATWAEVAAIAQTMRFMNLHRPENAPPIRWPFPWPEADAVSPEERAAAEAELERRSAFKT